jgi:hypothetical protein
MRRTHYILFAAILSLALGCQNAAEKSPVQEGSASMDILATQPSEVASEPAPSETATPDSGCPCPYAKQLRAEGKACPRMKAADGECPCAKKKGEGKEWSCPKMKAAHGECPYAKMKGEDKECPYAKMRGGHGSPATETTP